MKKTFKLLLIFLVYSGISAQDEKSYQQLLELPINKEIQKNGDVFLQADFVQIFTGQKDKSKISAASLEHFNEFNAPHPSVATVKKYLKDTSIEFNVPFPILDAIAKTYNNYTMIGVSEYGSFGIMGLVDNDLVKASADASKLTGISAETIKINPREHIRAAAALLSNYAGKNKKSTNLIDWFNAVKELSGLTFEDTKELQALDYFQVMNDGRSSLTLWKEVATVIPQNNNEVSKFITDSYARIKKTRGSNSTDRGATTGTVDFPEAVASFTDCNFGARNGATLDTYVNHYIAVGTAIGAVSYFRQCRPSAPSSAHFVIALNGTIYQSVKVTSNAFHAGVRVADGGDPNGNHRSIGTEHEVTAANPSSWNNETLLKASTDLARFFCDRYAIPKIRPASGIRAAGIRGHKEMPGASTDCPNILPWTRWMELLNGTTSNVPTPTAPAAGASVATPVALKWTSSVSGGSFRLQVSKVNTGWTAANGFTTDVSSNANTPVNYSAAGLLTYTWPNADTAPANRPVAGNTYYWTVRSYSSATGTSSYSTVRSFTVTSATARESINSGLLIYPNPSDGEITLKFNSNSENAELRLFNLAGNEVFSKKYSIQKGNNSLKEDVTGLKNGNYILILNDGEKILNQNIIIQNK